MAAESGFETEVAQRVWELKYRFRMGERVFDATPADTWARVASALAAREGAQGGERRGEFERALASLEFLPGGRILAGAGTGRRATLFNCFAMGAIQDSLEGIFEALREAALTMQQGGGVGMDFSTLRPRGTRARTTGVTASGPVSFMEIWDTSCRVLLSTGQRRGAMMATLRVDHPDIVEFIETKAAGGRLSNFNLSVLVSDDFMAAVERDVDWPLVFPTDVLGAGASGEATVDRVWSGRSEKVPCRVLGVVRARALWERLTHAAFRCGEPGVLFVDVINRANNLAYRERIHTTNPCGEIPLPAYGACNLGSLNLTRFVLEPFSASARLDVARLQSVAATAVRMLDDVIDVSEFPLSAQEAQARGTRRVGLGVTGLADALVMLGLAYDSDEGRSQAVSAMRAVRDAAYATSVALARERGPFPFFEKERYLEGPFVRALPEALRGAIAQDGIRNSHLTAIAPAGSISLLAENVSSGIEPIFSARYTRRMVVDGGTNQELVLTPFSVRLWERLGHEGLPPAFVDAHGVTPEAHVQMQAELQPLVDGAISKTVPVPERRTEADFRALFELAYRRGLKGFTVFREGAVLGDVLVPEPQPVGAAAGETPPLKDECC